MNGRPDTQNASKPTGKRRAASAAESAGASPGKSAGKSPRPQGSSGGKSRSSDSFATVVANASIIVCVGSGGVGKTTVAAAIALEAARRGRSVVVVTIDPARRLADAMGLTDGLPSIPIRVNVADPAHTELSESPNGARADGELWAMMLDTPAMLERVVAEHAADAEQVERIRNNQFFVNIANNLSGTQEYMASEALYELHNDPRFDLVIVDTPPSREALEFLESPGILSRFLKHRLFRALMFPTRTSMKMVGTASQAVLRQVGKVVGSDVLADAVAFFQAFAGMELGFQERAEAVESLLHDDGTEFVLITAPQHDTIAEATWFANELARSGFGVGSTILNRVMPSFGTATADTATGSDELPDEPFQRNLAQLTGLAADQRRAAKPLADLVGAASIVEVPLLPSDVHDLDGLSLIGARLFAQR